MTADYPLDYEPATPEYVLEVFRDWHRHAAAVQNADPAAVLTPETTLADWQDALEVESWGDSGLGGAMNRAWEIRVPAVEWQTFLGPSRWRAFPSYRTLGELCRFIAARTRRPVARPWRHAGSECLPAGFFLTARAMFAAAGADPDRITPASPLAPYLAARFREVWWPLVKLAPGRGPVRERFHPPGVGGLIGWLLLAGFCSVVAGALGVWIDFCGGGLAVLGGGLVVAALILDHATAGYRITPDRVRTFRDLSYALAGQEPRRRIQPTT